MNDQAYLDQIHEQAEKREDVQTLTQCSKQTFAPKESASERAPTRQQNESSSKYMHEFVYNPYMATRIVEDQLGVVVPCAERESTH
jgi:hypothetical protein